jgi:phage portal protein BeeE
VGLREAWSAFWNEPVKAKRGNVPYGSYRSTYLPGTGTPPWPGQAKLDYTRLVGRLDANSVVAICLGWLGDQHAQARPFAGYYEDGKPQPDEAHPMTMWLRGKPNKLHSWRQVWAATIAGIKVDGNAYHLLGGTAMEPELYWLPNDWVRVHTDKDGYVEYYAYAPNGIEEQKYSPDEILHYRDGIDPVNPVLGLSRLKRCIRSIAGLNAGDTYTASVLRNAHAGVMLIPREQNGMLTIDESALNAQVRGVQKYLTGENAGDVYGLNVPMDVEKVGMGPEEMALDRILDRPEATVCAALGVNSLVTGLPSSDASRTYSNLAEANKLAWENGLIPIQHLFAETLRDRLGPMFDSVPLNPDFVVDWDRSGIEALGEQMKDKVDREIALFTSSISPLGEIRQRLEMPPIEGDAGHWYGMPMPPGTPQPEIDPTTGLPMEAGNGQVEEEA